MVVSITLTAWAIVAILLGILVLVWPKFLRLVVGLYLIAAGIIQILMLNGII